MGLSWFLGQLAVAQTAREYQKMQTFEQQWTQFRYDLFPELYQISNNVRLLDSLITLKTTQKLDSFVQKNKAQIIDYQRIKLKSYTAYRVDFEAYQPDSVLSLSKIQEFNAEISQSMGQDYAQLLKFKSISPPEIIYLYFSLLIARRLTANEMANFYMRNSIASPLIISQLIEKDRWKVWFDTYQFLFEFEYDISQMACRPKQVWQRKKL
jgi:hypothetical protein